MTSSPEPALFAPVELPAPRGHRRSSVAPPGPGFTLPDLEAPAATALAQARADATAADYERGYAEALREAAARAGAEQDAALAAIRTVADRLEESERQFVRERERHVHGLAVAVARKLVQRELTADPSLTGALVARALELFPTGSVVDVRLHPDDLELLRPALERLAANGRELAPQWIADATLTRGDCVAESGLRIVDGRVDVALRAVFEALDHD